MITNEVLGLFNAKGEVVQLHGGQGTSVRVGDMVIKPVDNEDYYTFITKIWSSLNPTEYRISKPILSTNLNFVEFGYAANVYEKGKENDNRVEDKLRVSKLLHGDLEKININELPYSDDPWTKANNILWRNKQLSSNIERKSYELCNVLLKSLKPVNDKYQLIHSDLGGNILFDDELKPLVIDFSPTIAPAKYADAIIVCDSIAWAGASLETLNYLTPCGEYIEYIKRAVVFRVLTIAHREDLSFGDVNVEWMAYKKIWDRVVKSEFN